MKRIIIFLVTITLGLSSCQDIDLLPKDSLSDPLFWKSPADFEMATNDLYNTVLEGYLTGFSVDSESDITYRMSGDAISNGSWIASDVDQVWDNGFKHLRQANLILEKAESYSGNKDEIKKYVAEARFFRAYIYWKFLKRFSGVPIITKVLSVNSEELYGSRSSQADVEQFILSELDQIVNDLPLYKSLADRDKGRITQGAALALKARVALFAATWAKYHNTGADYSSFLDQAISASTAVIDSKQYSLFEGKGAQTYRYLFIEAGDDSPEDILSCRFYLNIRAHYSSSHFAWGRISPTRKIADMYLCDDGLPIDKSPKFQKYQTIRSEFENRDPRMAQTFLIPGTTYTDFEIGKPPMVCSAKFSDRPETRTGYKLWKFMGEVKGSDSQGEYDYHLIRYPEVLLILAEAYFEKHGNITDDILNKTINVIRNREGVKLPPLTNAFVKNNSLDMKTEIRRERTIELAFEGFRRDDLRRWKTAETELTEAIKGIKYKGTEYEDLNASNQGETDENGFLIVESKGSRQFVAPKHYYYSLPLNQLYLNPQLGPNNPGW